MNVVEVRQVGTGFSGWMRDDAKGVGIDIRTGLRIESEDTEGFTGTGEIVAVHNPFRPEFPESLLVPDRRAGQASSELADKGKSVWYIADAAPEELDAISKQPEASIVKAASEAEMRDTVARYDAWKAAPAPRIGQKLALLDEITASYREPVATLEAAAVAEKAQAIKGDAAADLAAKIVPLLLLGAPLHVLLRLFAGHPGIYALTELHRDTFNRTNNADIDGNTMSDTIGTWQATGAGSGGYKVDTNRAKQKAFSQEVYADSAMTAADVQRSHNILVTTGASTGSSPAVRCPGGTGGGAFSDYFDRYDGTNQQIYKNNGGGYSTLTGATTSPLADGSDHALDANGTTLTSYADASSVATATDSLLGTGKCGVHCQGYTDSLIEEWYSEVSGGGGGTTSHFLSLLGVGG